ncbi:NUDIX domain-containing protein [Clostridium fermenticellae]|uniref:NAD(+) diphosphatase n=1 Tax=Clostridium fermenticellae TaxID=2068654 RepID=A0A386H0B4_9CLOT|nr:NUDIX domain-containing protein [Clostridium fermenticellae]AYD39080.1 NUDIX domain-containing protein [Clostridium fermenticellae]
MKFNYCPICGNKLEIKYSWDEGGVPYCPIDDIMYFNTPKPCIMVAILKDDKILLLKQSYIFKNSKVLLSGYVTSGETIEETVHREVFEEAGIKVKNLEYLGSRYLEAKDIEMIEFMAYYDTGEIKRSSEVEGMNWEYIDNALDEMVEDEIGKSIVSKVLKKIQR